MADKFLRGAMILTMAGLMVKILGSHFIIAPFER